MDTKILFLESGFGNRSRLLALRKDNAKVEPLLEQSSSWQVPGGESSGASATWEWPEPQALKETLFATDGEGLWALSPREYYGSTKWVRLSFADDRHATLIRFEPGLHRALAVPIRFEKDHKPMYISPSIGGGWPDKLFYISFWFNSPDGLIGVSPQMLGHWFIPKETLRSRFEKQEKLASPQTPSDSQNVSKP